MTIQIFAGQPHQKLAAQRFQAGLRRHAIPSDIVAALHGRPDFVVCWSWHIGKNLREHGHNVLVMERGYVGDRFVWTSLAWNGLNGRGRFPVVDDGGERWRRWHSHAMKEWRDIRGSGDAPILLLGQVPTDASVRLDGGFRYAAWVESTAKTLREHGRPILYRAHPEALKRGADCPPSGVDLDKGTLAEALDRCAWAVTFNSNSAVDAVLAGVPTVTHDHGAMAWNVTGHRLAEQPPQLDREAWAQRLACCQWMPEEIESGEAWDVLRLSAPVQEAA